MPKFFEPEKEEANQLTSELTSQKELENSKEEDLHPKMVEAGEIKTLLNWTAPGRPYRRRDRSYYTTIAILVVLLSLIAILAQEFLLIGVFLAIAFVAYVLAFIPPEEISHKISTQGVTIGDHFYFWHELDSFWFKEKEGQEVLFIQTRLRFPGQLMLVLGEVNQDEIQKAVARFLPFHEIPQTTTMDRFAESLQKHFPLENTHH